MALTIDDAYWQFTPSSDREAQDIQPSPAPTLTLKTQVNNLQDEPLLAQLQPATETQEAVTIEEAELIDYRPFLSDMQIEDVNDPGHLSRIGPIISSILRIRETGIELRDIALGLYILPQHEGRWRLTNRQDPKALVAITIDLTPVSGNVPDNVIVIDPQLSLTIELRPVQGYSLRDVLKLYTFLRALREPQVVEIINKDASEVLFIARGVHINDPSLGEDPLIDALETIQNAFPTTTFPMPDTLGREDTTKIFEIAEIVRSGQVTVAFQEMSAQTNVETLVELLSHADEDGVLQYVDENGVAHWQALNIRQEHTMHILFTVSLDLGPSRADFPPMKLSSRTEELRKQIAHLSPNSNIALKLVPATPENNDVRYHYERYEANQRGTDSHDASYWEAYDDSPTFLERVARADAQVAAGLGFTNVTTEALDRFCALDGAETQRLLADREELARWLAAHA